MADALHALILAAGRGTRLTGVADGPKCLLELGDGVILDRYLRLLARREVPVTVVTGHAADRMAAHLRQWPAVHTVWNPRFTDGSILSLARGLESVRGPLLLLDGDVCFHPALLDRLIDAPVADALLVDLGTDFTGEEYLAGVDDGRVTALRRGPVPGHAAHGEWVGFARLSATTVEALHASITTQIAQGATQGGYEDALSGLLDTVSVHAIPVDGLAWVEIDFPHDLARAQALVAAGRV